jgi:hypothetical protein
VQVQRWYRGGAKLQRWCRAWVEVLVKVLRFSTVDYAGDCCVGAVGPRGSAEAVQRWWCRE